LEKIQLLVANINTFKVEAVGVASQSHLDSSSFSIELAVKECSKQLPVGAVEEEITEFAHFLVNSDDFSVTVDFFDTA